MPEALAVSTASEGARVSAVARGAKPERKNRKRVRGEVRTMPAALAVRVPGQAGEPKVGQPGAKMSCRRQGLATLSRPGQARAGNAHPERTSRLRAGLRRGVRDWRERWAAGGAPAVRIRCRRLRRGRPQRGVWRQERRCVPPLLQELFAFLRGDRAKAARPLPG